MLKFDEYKYPKDHLVIHKSPNLFEIPDLSKTNESAIIEPAFFVTDPDIDFPISSICEWKIFFNIKAGTIIGKWNVKSFPDVSHTEKMEFLKGKYKVIEIYNRGSIINSMPPEYAILDINVLQYVKHEKI